MRFALDMCCALDMPCGARKGFISYRMDAWRPYIDFAVRKNIEFATGEHIDSKVVVTVESNKNQLREDSIEFVLAISETCDDIKGCSVFVNQLLRSSSSIGANIHEARYARSRADSISKLEIALKESSETDYWLELLYRKKKFSEEQYKFLRNCCGSIRRRLIASITTAKSTKEK